jgi:SAM-dependent methyltransferase
VPAFTRYARPELYETVYDDPSHAVPKMCEQVFERYLGRLPASLLDIGCGTGRDLAYLAERCPDCVGVDVQAPMIEHARRLRPHIDVRVDDMRTLRLDRTFEAIASLGIAIANLQGDDDVTAAFATFAAHAEPGTLLVLEALNAVTSAGGGTLPRGFVIDTPQLRATADATYEFDRRHQLLSRRRVWDVADGEPVEDFVRFRTLAPLALDHRLAWHGFQTLAMYDNHDLLDSELSGASLLTVARFGQPARRRLTRWRAGVRWRGLARRADPGEVNGVLDATRLEEDALGPMTVPARRLLRRPDRARPPELRRLRPDDRRLPRLSPRNRRGQEAVTFARELGAYLAVGVARLLLAADACLAVPMGATVVGTGLGVGAGYVERILPRLREVTGLELRRHGNFFDAIQNGDVFRLTAAADASAPTPSVG